MWTWINNCFICNGESAEIIIFINIMKRISIVAFLFLLFYSSYSQNQDRPFLKQTVFNMYVESGVALCSTELPVSFDINFGARVYDYAFFGLSISADLIFESYHLSSWDFEDVFIPVGFDIRGFIPANRNFYPYVEFASSMVFLPSSYYLFGAKIRAGMGFEIGRFSFGLGYMTYRGDPDGKWNLGYAKIGIRIGKK